jgi:CBS domain-containing protein
MRTIGQLLNQKGNKVVTVRPEETVLDAAEVMNEHHIGAVVVTRDGDDVVGIFTERDILRRVVAERRDPVQTRVREVMTSTVACCSPNTPLDEVRALMRNRRIRHVPVVEEGRLVGIVSIGDLNIVNEQIQEETIQYLEHYMYRP